MSRTGENIYKRKDGRWEARYIFKYDENGKARYRYLYAKTYSEVKAKLLKAQSDLLLGVETKRCSSDVKYDYWLDEWLKSKQIVVKTSTYIRYRNAIENHIRPELGKYPVNRISTGRMEQFTADKLQKGRLDQNGGLSPKTVSDLLVIVKETLKYAQFYGETITCCFDRISLKRTKQEMRVLSIKEQKRLLHVIFKDSDLYKLGVFLCLYTGIRIGELCALQWRDISLTESTIKINKTLQRIQNIESASGQKTRIIITEPKSASALRIIPLPDFVTEMLIDFHASENAYLLSGKEDVYVEPRTMQYRFKSYLNAACIADANFHSLRHTFATRCIEVGFDIKTLSEILGHSSVKLTLDKYVHSSMQLKRNNMKKLLLETL